ncbi:hypothetical protein E4T42_06503 [Aureobasidium subglaciale]|nr:hypothetical protein E4T42_06503 [Aureobasidium subglaciale]
MSNFSWRPPTVPFEAQTRDGSPFTVWHVCMICQQPRSARYHSEHPIYDYNAYTSSQTICRRCAAKTPAIPAPSIPEADESVSHVAAMRHIPFRHIAPLSPPPAAPPAPIFRAVERQSAVPIYTPVLESVVPSHAPSSRTAWGDGGTYHVDRKAAPLANVRPAPARRVSFSREDEVVTLPEELPSERTSMQGLSRMRLQPPNLSGMRDAAADYEYDKHSKNVYIDPSERSYVSEPKWTPLSESPARELPLAEESYAHGPYRAEVSPSPSMRVHVDNYDFVPIDKSGNDLAYKPIKPADPAAQKSEHVYQGKQQEGEMKDEDRAWTKFTTVREYIDDQGPYMEVEEKIVFDD